MELKDIKRLVAFARRSGIKSLKVADFAVEFTDAAVAPTQKRLKVVEDGPPSQPPPRFPTLDEINSHIYTDTEVG